MSKARTEEVDATNELATKLETWLGYRDHESGPRPLPETAKAVLACLHTRARYALRKTNCPAFMPKMQVRDDGEVVVIWANKGRTLHLYCSYPELEVRRVHQRSGAPGTSKYEIKSEMHDLASVKIGNLDDDWKWLEGELS